MHESADHELLAQYAHHNSEEAYALLVERHLNLVYSVAMRQVADPHKAEEITHVVFLILARRAGSLSPKVILTGWLYRATRLTAANYLRREMRQRNREQEAYMQSLANERAPDIWNRIAPLLDTAMEQLNHRERDAVLLRFFEDKSFKEVGEALQTNEDTAQKRVDRALKKLRGFFGKHGVTLSAATLMGVLSSESVQAAPAGLAQSTIAAGLTKGASFSGSSVALMKSTMKLMTWLKIKTTLVVGAAVLLVAGTTTVTVAQIEKATIAQVQPPGDTNGQQSPSQSPTDLKSYLARFKEAVDSHWSPKMVQQRQSLVIGRVRVRYTISPDGTVTATMLDGSNADLSQFMGISVKSIRETSPFLPFPPSMIEQYPKGYTGVLTFSSYGSTPISTDPLPLLAPLSEEEARQKGIAAMVNGQAILWSRIYHDTGELEGLLKQKMEGDKLHQRISNIRELARIGLIKRVLAIESFKNSGGTLPDADVDAQIDEIVKTNYGGDRDSLLKNLASQGTTLAKYREGIANDSIIGVLQKQHEKDWAEWLDSLMASATIQKFEDPNGLGFQPEDPKKAFPDATTGIDQHENPVALTGYVTPATGTMPPPKNPFLDAGSLNFAPTNAGTPDKP